MRVGGMIKTGLINIKKMKKIGWLLLLIAVLFVAILFTLDKGTIKIGFSGSLSSNNSPLGIAVKDGVVLAVEQINAQGGIRGKMIQLIIKDDENNPETARKVDAQLISEGVVAIVGHVTSAMTEAVLTQINEKKMLLLSPTTSSLRVLDQDDYLISIHPPNIYEQEELARYVIDHTETKTVSIIYDANNSAFSQHWADYFSDTFKGLGGSIDLLVQFNSQTSDLQNGVAVLLENKPEAVLIVASAIDTALICQQIEKRYPKQVLKLSSGWSLDDNLLEQGGSSVNGLVLPSSWDKESTAADYLAFKDTFIKRYQREPEFAESYGYEAIMLLAQILDRPIKPAPGTIKNEILNTGEFEGLQGKIIIDRLGKTKRDVFLFMVQERSFKRIAER